MIYLENVFVGLTILYPIAWIVIANGKYGMTIANDVRNMIIHEAFLVSLLAALFLAPVVIPRVSNYMELYIVFFGLFPLLFRKKMGIHLLPLLFCTSALSVFVASEFWEYPVFVYGTLGIFHIDFQDWAGGWMDQIHRIYGFVILYFLLRSVNWRKNALSLGFMILSVLLPFLLLSPLFFNSWSSPIVVRVSTLICVGFGIYFGLDIEDFSILSYKAKKQKNDGVD